MPECEVVRVGSRRDLEAFVGLPYRLHRADPSWTPPLRRDVRARLDPRRHPLYDHAEASLFVDGFSTPSAVMMPHNPRYQRPLGTVLLPLVVLLAFGTVYGQLHYAIDAVAGALLGALVLVLAARGPLAGAGVWPAGYDAGGDGAPLTGRPP